MKTREQEIRNEKTKTTVTITGIPAGSQELIEFMQASGENAIFIFTMFERAFPVFIRGQKTFAENDGKRFTFKEVMQWGRRESVSGQIKVLQAEAAGLLLQVATGQLSMDDAITRQTEIAVAISELEKKNKK